jgi:hypothetical protein
MSAARSPFTPRAVLALVLGGGLLFVALLWLIGAGLGSGQINDGSAHAGSKGLTGYAAMADFLERRGKAVSMVRTRRGLEKGELLILTPPADAKGAELAKLVEEHRYMGPTLIITPKWSEMPIGRDKKEYKRGWVMIGKPELPKWEGFYDQLQIEIAPMREDGSTARWQGAGQSGELPNSEQVLSGLGDDLVPLVVGEQDGRILAGYLNDAGDYPALREITAGQAPEPIADEEDELDYEIHPVILVFEPDLLNNYGLADAANAQLAERLVKAALDNHDGHQGVAFDLTFNGFGRSQNLLTLAFQPPFLAATLCLLLAALVLGWRAFLRFGPPLSSGPALAFGKTALVGNAAALLRRARRLHLSGQPYAEAAIDRALAARAPQATAFSIAAAKMRAARHPADLVSAAQLLHSLERTLKR